MCGTLHEGFVDHVGKICVFTDHQIFDRFHKYTLKSDRARSGKLALSLKELGQIEVGDYIVHLDHGVGRFAGLLRTNVNGKMQEEDKNKHQFFCQMLKKADLNITDFHPVLEDRSLSQDFREHIQQESIPASVKNELLRPMVESVVFENHSKNGTFDVSLKLQSKGTLKFIRILDSLYDLISGNHIYYLDELGEDLHYDLLFYYLNIFLFNSDQSQLLITSQETTLLSQDMINDNRGVVWFVEKNKETASSEYSRGDSYGLHKNLSLYNSYRIGRLGAKPELGSIFVDLEG